MALGAPPDPRGAPAPPDLRHGTRTTGRFSLDVSLPAPVDTDAVSASLDHGVLTVVVPKAEQAHRRRIPISHRR